MLSRRLNHAFTAAQPSAESAISSEPSCAARSRSGFPSQPVQTAASPYGFFPGSGSEASPAPPSVSTYA